MASEETWKKLKYFKKTENWGNYELIQDDHLLRLDAFRAFIRCPIVVTRGTATSGHSEKSFHYSQKDARGNEIGYCATDLVIPAYENSPFDLVLHALRFFNGVGFYPHWSYKGHTCGGIHVDSRPIGLQKSIWMGVLGEDKKQKYIELSFDNLLKYYNDPQVDVILN